MYSTCMYKDDNQTNFIYMYLQTITGEEAVSLSCKTFNIPTDAENSRFTLVNSGCLGNKAHLSFECSVAGQS